MVSFAHESETPLSHSPVQSLDDITIIEHDTHRRSVRAAALGNVMEWFDFGVYSYLAATIGQVFFSGASHSLQLIAAFGTFAAAFLVRPIGGMVFGPLGDVIGRQKVLSLTMIMMSIATFCLGLIPSYASIGVAAPLLLLLVRLVQGFSTGGEYGGAATFIAEYSTDKKRGYAGSFLELGTITGYLLGALVVSLLSFLLSEQAMHDWGWRIPFFVSAPLGIFGLYIRLKLEETPAFRAHLEKQQQLEREKPATNMLILLKEQLGPLMQCVGLVLLFNVSNYMLTAYMPSYLEETLGLGNHASLLLIIMLMFVMLPLTVMWGRLTDSIGRRPVLAFGALGLVVLAYPAFLLLSSNAMWLVFLGLVILGIFHSCFSGTTPSALPALFPTHIRYSALAIGFNLSVSIFGGTTPLINSWLVEATGNSMVPAFYMIATGLIGLVTVWSVKESARKPLEGSQPAVGSKDEAHKLLAALKGHERQQHAPAR
ncbi:glycine betaine/L-proline transporter ProP [Carnimonas nigrificans]|uniref:glycine betaine/L-proline transporter ProP n=1 Tax=Carnimonas nigrificans TaxID=64323 RepID=UPI0004B25C5A|nr:glycine betaine/L-proline transporter ProP [Carnimonas nigrificans]